MRPDLQPVAGIGLSDLRANPRPFWLRVLALLCVAVVFIMSSAQVCHVHPNQAPIKQGSGHSDPVPEDHCPLCVAMHSALPAGIQQAPEPVVAMHALDLVAADAGRLFRWRFELASRPPPTTDSLA